MGSKGHKPFLSPVFVSLALSLKPDGAATAANTSEGETELKEKVTPEIKCSPATCLGITWTHF